MDITIEPIPTTHFVCVRIHNEPLAFPLPVPFVWERILLICLGASHRGRGVLVPGQAAVKTKGMESIALLEVTDWKAAVVTILAEMEAQKLLKGLSMAWRCNAEEIWRPCYPEGSTEDFAIIAARFLEWAKAAK